MKLIIIGCEYSGTTTLAVAVNDWLREQTGTDFRIIHDHWKIPHTSGHPDDSTTEEQEWLLAATPKFKEMHQRHSLYYHAQYRGTEPDDSMLIGGAIEDGVYGPMYFGYGGPGHRLDRETVQHQWEQTLLYASDAIVLVHVTADDDVIKQRMQDDPHENMVISEGDIGKVKNRFAELVEWSVLTKKIQVDNSGSMEDTMAEFVSKMEPYFTDVDRKRMKERSS